MDCFVEKQKKDYNIIGVVEVVMEGVIIVILGFVDIMLYYFMVI